MLKSFLQKNWGALITIFIILIFLIVWKSIPFGELLLLVRDNMFLAVIFYVIFHIISDIFAPIGASPLFIAGFYLMGNWLYLGELLSAIITSILNFYIARKWGLQFIALFVSKGGVEKIKDILKELDRIPLLQLRLFTFSFNDYASYAYGLTHVGFCKYFIMSIVMSIFWLLIWKLFLINTIINIGVFYIWFYAMSIPFFLISWISLKLVKSKRKSNIAR